MLKRLLLISLLLTLCASAQRKVDTRNSYDRVIGIVPLTGSGTPADPKRPKYAPWPAAQAQDGILAFYFELTDDGKSAVVEFTAANHNAFQTLFNDKTITIFEKGRATKTQIETAVKPFRKDFDLDKFGLPMPSGSIAGPPAAGYAYYLTDSFTAIDTSKWTVAGTIAASHGGLTASDPNGGSVISRMPVPDGTSEAEVRATITLAASSGSYTEFLQSSADARSGGAGAGSYLAFEMQNPTFTGNQCAANFVVLQSAAASTSVLASFPHSCRTGMTMRMAVHTGMLLVWADEDVPIEFALNAPAAGAGQPGVGAHGTPAGNAISLVQLGGVARTAPLAISQQSLHATPFPNRVDVQWSSIAPAAASPGLAGYWIYRDGLYFQRTSKTTFQDETVAPQSTHTYTVYAVDQHFNFSPGTSITVTTPAPLPRASQKFPFPPTNPTVPPKPKFEQPQIAQPEPRTGPSGGWDPRRVGVQPTGAYWGAAGEQIDLASMNLNFSVPLLAPKGRSGWSVPFRLSYNSQMWRQDSNGEWLLGQDVGYGLGWKLLAGAITPIWANTSQIDHYLYTDATGAEYRLDQNNGNVWTSMQGIYVSFDANANVLHFNDGTYWTMGCQSAGGEQDAGTLYPTAMEDTNGNQIQIFYLAGAGTSAANTSARISYIADARSYLYYWDPTCQCYVTPHPSAIYSFTYNGDATPHLTQITNAVSSAEAYTFGYLEGQPLNSPFSGASFGNTTLMSGITVTGLNVSHSFQYGTGAGEMTQMTNPLGGTLQWQYRSFTYGTGITQREVYYRFMPQYAGVTWVFAHADSYDSAQPYHVYTQYWDTQSAAAGFTGSARPVQWLCPRRMRRERLLTPPTTWTSSGHGARMPLATGTSEPPLPGSRPAIRRPLTVSQVGSPPPPPRRWIPTET